MANMTLTIELEYDADAMHGDDYEACIWFINEVLHNSGLHLFSDEIGDYVGTVKVIDLPGTATNENAAVASG